MEMVDTVTCGDGNDDEMENAEECCDTVTTRTEVAVQTEETEDHRQLKEEMEELKKENDHLKLTNHHLTLKVEEQSFTEDNFRNNDKKVLYYTGLCKWELFVALFEYIKPCLQTTGKSSFSSFLKLLLTLMRLRNNLSFPDLGYRFEIHPTTFSHIFNRVLDLLFIKLKPLIKWPKRAALKKTMPMVFRKHFPNCVVIIDCFDIFLERPTHLLARAQTYSSYKHHNTVKYLIGITPQGTVSFISEAWGGQTSDKYITEHSNIMICIMRLIEGVAKSVWHALLKVEAVILPLLI